MIPKRTCKYLNSQLKKYLSNENPSPAKCNPKNKSIASPNEAWIVFGRDSSNFTILKQYHSFEI